MIIIYNYHKVILQYISIQNDDISNIEQSFQDGCSKIASKITSLGVTTASNASIDTIVNNINTLATNKYNSGVAAGESSGSALSYKRFTLSSGGGSNQNYSFNVTITAKKSCGGIILVRYKTTRNGQWTYPTQLTSLSINGTSKQYSAYDNNLVSTNDGKYDGAGAMDVLYYIPITKDDVINVKGSKTNYEMVVYVYLYAPLDFSYS